MPRRQIKAMQSERIGDFSQVYSNWIERLCFLARLVTACLLFCVLLVEGTRPSIVREMSGRDGAFGEWNTTMVYVCITGPSERIGPAEPIEPSEPEKA